MIKQRFKQGAIERQIGQGQRIEKGLSEKIALTMLRRIKKIHADKVELQLRGRELLGPKIQKYKKYMETSGNR